MARIDYARSAARGCCGLGNRGTGKHQSPESYDQKRLQDLVDYIDVNPSEESSSLLQDSASYEGDVRLATAEVDFFPLVLFRPVLRQLPCLQVF
jgi:hypothetical protein